MFLHGVRPADWKAAVSKIVAALSSAAHFLRAVLGVPDYSLYAAHMRANHPGCVLLTEEQFEQDRAESRYNRPGSRCC